MRWVLYVMTLAWVALLSLSLQAKELVSPETVRLQKRATHSFTVLKGVPVSYRQVANTDIVLVGVSFDFGAAHLEAKARPALQILGTLMERGSKSYPRDTLLALLERNGTGINCSFGVELGSCSMAMLKDQMQELLPAFRSILLEPTLDAAEAQVIREQVRAGIESSVQNPESYVNEVVNSIFYGKGHPYWDDQDTELKAIGAYKHNDLILLHNRLLKDVPKRLVVVGPMPPAEMKSVLEKQLDGLTTAPVKSLSLPNLQFNPKKSFKIVDRDIPTAYLRAKFVMPGARDADLLPAQLMLHILSQELENEIRTKRSLSYAVSAQMIPYTMGIGLLHASTSKPKETLEALEPVIRKLRDEKLAAVELERYKTVFATSYFLNLEEHGSLANSISGAMHYYRSTNPLYEMPMKLAKVTPDDIQKAAQKYLRQFRLGVVYRQKDFSRSWADPLLKAFP
jgi:zinc protease